MPLQSSDRTLHQAGESRKPSLPRERPSTASSRDHSEQRGKSTRELIPQRGQDVIPGKKLSNEELEALRMNVPENMFSRGTSGPMKRQTSQSTDEEKENAEPYQWRVKRDPDLVRSNAYRSENYEQGDNDTSMTFGDTGWEPAEETCAQQTAIFRGDVYNKLASTNSPALKEEAQRAIAARRNTQRMNQKSTRVQYERHQELYDAEEASSLTDDEFDSADEQTRRLANETPSRAGTFPAMQKVPSHSRLHPSKSVVFALQEDRPRDSERARDSSSPIDQVVQPVPAARKANSEHPSPEANPHSSLARHAQNRLEIKQIVVQGPLHSKPLNSNASAKVFAFDEVAAEDLQNPFQPYPTTATTKRARDEIDYDLEDLNTKPYNALDEVPFLTNPRAPVLPVQVDASGNDLPTLSARLNNLSNMRSEDQKSLFLSLTDDEIEQTGQFFVECFSDNLKNLMEKRLERRKIALKYELEARKRQKAIEVKQKQCEDELGELRTGGNKLVEGRSVDKIGMTPRKAPSIPQN